jgi:Mrp family chromosome partitioning ATPase
MKRHNLHVDSLVHEFRLLRNRIEAEVQPPALIFITSGSDSDGAGFAAHGIAESLSRTHQRTVLVTSDPALARPAQSGPAEPLRRRASDRVDAPEGPRVGGVFSVVCLSTERVATISRTRVAEMVQELRSSNDYVVVDAGNLAKNGLGLLLVGSADAVILAFRSGRAQQEGDQFLLDTLERAESKTIGVIMTDQDAIDHFLRRDESGAGLESPAENAAAGHNEAPKPKPATGVLQQVSSAPAKLAKRLELALSRLVN